MRKSLILTFAIALLALGCHHDGTTDTVAQATASDTQCVASFRLGNDTELRLLSDGGLSQLELYYGGELQELVGTANTDYIRNEAGQIALDTVCLDGNASILYIVRTYDRSSTYGAEVWYVLYPYRRGDPDGPWNLIKVPDDKPTLQSVEQYIR